MKTLLAPVNFGMDVVLEKRSKITNLLTYASLYDEDQDYLAADTLRVAAFMPPKWHEPENFCKKFITQDSEMLAKLRDLNKLAYTNDTVLLRGPTGVGKEVIASCLGPYRTGQFVSLNCSALPDNLAESLLFGHTKGSFTGASLDHMGFLKAADDGVLFLDEFSDLSPEVQAKLLRAIETRRFWRIGNKTETTFNCRIICATCKDTSNSIRTDLYARICAFEYHIPSLADRPGDAELIMESLYPGFPREKIVASHPHNVRRLKDQARQMTVLGKTL